ncbi:MAG TPA: glycosyltransferase [Terriglobales bacterium]|nr:glycosyltransferase [Terriglobales bacterium]
MRGGEKCLETFCELYPEADLYTLIYIKDKVSPTLRRMKVHASWLNRLPGIEHHYRYLLGLFPSTIETFDLRHYDLIISSSHCVAKGIFPHRALHVAYVHAPMRYIWDKHGDYFGRDASCLSRFAMSLCRRHLQSWDVASSQRVDCFIANSRNVAVKINQLYNRQATVIYPPVDRDKFRIASRLDNYYLMVSALVPYKRADLAIAAFNRLRRPLKIVGDGPLRARLQRRAQSNIEFLGWVDDQTLVELYASCQSLIFPGEEEFGIVPVEAQSSGRPVIAFGRGGTRETIIGFDESSRAAQCTGVFFGEPSPESLVVAVDTYEQHRDEFDPIFIRQHTAQFARARFKQEIAGYIDEVLRRHRGDPTTC